tara:strand:+ start:402 stop:770 length:369 start_codon:yes stop_codon:yes gene_type:complete
MSESNGKNIKKGIIEIIQERKEKPISLNDYLRKDLGFYSVDIMGIVLDINERFDIKLSGKQEEDLGVTMESLGVFGIYPKDHKVGFVVDYITREILGPAKGEARYYIREEVPTSSAHHFTSN